MNMVYNCDCMDLMAIMPDNMFDLAIVDPPYGLGQDGGTNHNRSTNIAPATKFKIKSWDKNSVSKDQLDDFHNASPLVLETLQFSKSWLI